MGKFILSDFSRVPLTGEPAGTYKQHPTKWLGHCVVSGPLEAHTVIDFTGPPGSVSGIYYSLMFQLGKWEHNVQKASEWIEVSPVHAQYYQLTHKQKEELEGRIKSGLQSVSQSVADLELILHDKRKYDEFLHYMGYRTPAEAGNDCKNHGHMKEDMDDICFKVDEDDKTRKEREKRVDNHSLKAVFIDQVDIHTGDGVSIRSIVQRWPTLVIDFMKVDDNDMDIGKVSEKLDISRAEAVVLITKNKLYQEWKRLFVANLKDRYIRIQQVARARNASVDKYREWLTPVIARHKLIEEGLSSAGNRGKALTSFITAGGHAISSSNIEIWVWKDFETPEIFKSGSEDKAKIRNEEEPWKWRVTPYDEWTKKNLIFNKKHGLIMDYPWITDEWCKEKLKEFYGNGWLTRHKFYYSFFIIGLEKTNMRMPTGDEFEDGMFDVNMLVMSQNAVFTKLLELKAKQMQFEKYVNDLLGMPTEIKGEPPKIKEKETLKPVKDFFDYFSLDLQFFKRGPYERDWDERLTKYYFAPIAGSRYAAIVGFIKSKVGMGK